MPRFQARDLSRNGPSYLAGSTEQNKHILMFNSASGDTGDAFFARDFPGANAFVIDIDVGSGDTVVIETRADSSAAWATEQTVTVDTAYVFVPTEQFRIRRTVASTSSKAWLTARK